MMVMKMLDDHDHDRSDGQIDGITPPESRTGMIDGAWFTRRAIALMNMRMTIAEMPAPMLPDVKAILQPKAEPDDQRCQTDFKVDMKCF